MLSSEFLIEAISLSKYKNEALNAVRDAIFDAMSELSDDLNGQDFEDARYDTEGNHINEYIRKPLIGYFQIHLKRHLEDKLTTVARNMVGSGNLDKRGSWVNVKFKDTGVDLGAAYPDNTVGLSEKEYLDQIIKGLAQNIIEFAIDNHSGQEESFLEPIKYDLIKRLPSDKMLQDFLIRDWDSSEIIKQMIRTFIHEVVHIAQHLPQQKKGRYQTAYTSYLAKNKDFYRAFQRDPTTGEYKDHSLMAKLHGASPQEIGAFTHNLAMEIVDSMDWDSEPEFALYYNSKEHHNELVNKIQDHLRDRGILSKTPAEVAVFKRYLKMVYTEVEKYRQYIIAEFNKDKEKEKSTETGLKSQIKSRLGKHLKPNLPEKRKR